MVHKDQGSGCIWLPDDNRSGPPVRSREEDLTPVNPPPLGVGWSAARAAVIAFQDLEREMARYEARLEAKCGWSGSAYLDIALDELRRKMTDLACQFGIWPDQDCQPGPTEVQT